MSAWSIKGPRFFISMHCAKEILSAWIPSKSSLMMIISWTYRRKKVVTLAVLRRNKCMIIKARLKNIIYQGKMKLWKSGMMCLFQTIKSVAQFGNFSRWIRITRRRFHINIFSKITIWKSFHGRTRTKEISEWTKVMLLLEQNFPYSQCHTP